MSNLFLGKFLFQADQNSLQKLKSDLEKVVSRTDKTYIKAIVEVDEAKRKLKELEEVKNKALKTNDKGLYAKATIDVATAKASLRELEDAMRKTDNRLGGFKQGLGEIGAYVKGAFGIASILEFGKSVFRITAQLQDIQSGFKVLLGDQEKSVKIMNDISNLAQISKFDTVGLAQQTQLLLGFGFTGEQVIPIVNTLANSMQAVGRTQEDLNRVSLAIGQILSKGRLSAEEMNQLTEAGIPAYTILQEKLNLSAKEMQNLGNSGIDAKTALIAIFSELDSKFGNAIEESAGNLSTKWNSFIDGMKISLSKFGLDISDTMGSVIDTLEAAFNGVVPVVLKILADILGAVKGTFSTIADVLYALTGTTEEEVQKVGGFWNVLGIFISALWIGIKTIVLSVMTDIGKAIMISGQNIGIAFSNIFEIAKVVFFNVGQVVRNGIENIRVSAGMIGEAFSITFNNAIDAVEGFINGASEGFNKFTGWIADKTGADWIRTDVQGFSLQGYKLGISGAEGIGRGITDGLKDIPEMTPFKEYNFELSRLDSNVKAFAQNDGLIKMLDRTGKTASGAKKSFEELLKDLPGVTGAGDSAKKGAKETEAFKKSVDNLKSSYSILQNELKKVKDATDKAHDAEKKWNETLREEQEKTEKSIIKVREEYEKTIDTLNKDANKSSIDTVGDYYRSLIEEEKKLKEDLFKAQQENIGTAFLVDPAIENGLASVRKQIAEIQSSGYLDQNTRAREDQRASLSDQEKERFDFMEKYAQIQLDLANKTSEATDKFAESRAQIEGMQYIIKFFKNESSTGSLFESKVKSLKLQYGSDDQISLIEKLAKEKRDTIEIEREKIASETRVNIEAKRLADEYHAHELELIQSRKAEYDSLIEKINIALNKTQALNAMSTSRIGGGSYAEGGYTGDGGKYEVAGEVHKGEYVIPQHVISKMHDAMPNVLPILEKLRTGSSSTSHIDQSRHVSITGPIRVEKEIDFERLLSRAAWRNR